MYADTVSELLSAVIPGYDELPSNENGDEAAFVARYEAAIELANLVQTGLVIDATENDGWSPEQVTEDELNALFQSKVVPFVPCDGADGTVSAEWRRRCSPAGDRHRLRPVYRRFGFDAPLKSEEPIYRPVRTVGVTPSPVLGWD